MSFRLKAATLAAFALSAIAAVTAADMTLASEASLSNNTTPVQIASGDIVPAQPAKPVIFGARREVVQPLDAKTPAASANQATPAPDMEAVSLAALVDAQGAPEELSGDMQCLAGGIYFESKGESLEGQLAVARVIINRARSGRFADSLCGVIYQRSQFSFVRGNSMPAIRTSGDSWREAVAIAQIAMDDSWDSRAEGALYFHARRVSPGWGRQRLATIDNHVFYR